MIADHVECHLRGPHPTGHSTYSEHRSLPVWRRGVDIHKVQRLLGYSRIVTTARYLHLNDADLADAVDAAFPAS